MKKNLLAYLQSVNNIFVIKMSLSQRERGKGVKCSPVPLDTTFAFSSDPVKSVLGVQV